MYFVFSGVSIINREKMRLDDRCLGGMNYNGYFRKMLGIINLRFINYYIFYYIFL